MMGSSVLFPIIIMMMLRVDETVGVVENPCSSSPTQFFSPPLNGSTTTSGSSCIPVPVNAAPTANGLGWSCVDGTVGTYGLKKYNLPCSAYSFSSTLGNAAPCSPYASAGLSEGYSTFGWCVNCQTAGNCPGAWAQVDLGLVGNVAGVYVSGRSGFCNFPLTLSVKSSLDGVTWDDVDGGNIFSTGMVVDYRCGLAASSYMVQKPLSTIRFAAPLMARYLRVYPLTRTGYPVWNTYGAYYVWWMCMQFEPLAVSDASSNLVVAYPFASPSALAQGYGSLPSVLSGLFSDGSQWTNALGGGLQLVPGQVAYSPYIDFTDFSEFTLTYWTSVNTYSCVPNSISFGLVDETGKIFYGVAPCYGTSYMKMTFDGTKSYNCFGGGQDPYGKNRQTLHGRRSGNGTTNYFWFGQGGGVDESNGMSSIYEVFKLPKWPGKLRLSFGSPGHKHIIKMHDVRLYRDSALTGVYTGTTGRVPMDTAPTPKYLPSMDSCAICQPGFYCANNQVFACPANSSAGYHASAISQCVCNAGLFKDPVLGCRACRSGFYCPNENSEVPCSVGCSNTVGVLYQSASCSSTADRVCTACPSTSAAATAMGVVPAACVCPANSYNNGTGLGCSVCPQNAVSAAHSYGLGACSCVSGFFNTPTVDNATGQLLALACTLCPAGTYSLANTQVCFPFPANTVASDKSPLGFFCPNGYFMPTDVPVMINASTGYPTRPGLIYWNFESTSFSVMKNEWGNYSLTNYIPPKIFPESTTADIKALNPNAQCKFGTRCALIGGTSSAIYKYTLTIPPFIMPAKGISVSFWFRINSCQSCGIYELSTTTIGVESWNFAGVSAKHDNLNSNLYFAYNGISTAGSHSYWSLTNTWDGGYAALKNSWHHYLYTFLPGGNFSGYIDGIRRASKLFNKEFPSTVTGSFFLPNYYNGMVDDFAIFEGDVAPYLSNLLTKPANQALDGTGIAAACVPCFNGMYCNNNTATTCPNNKTNALPLSSWETDCQCNEPGMSGNGNFTTCSTLCPANSYCLGGGFPRQVCPKNRISATNTTLLSQCLCPLPFSFDYLGNCVCPSIINTQSPNGDQCICANGYTGFTENPMTVQYPSLYKCGTAENSQCQATAIGSSYRVSDLFDSVNPEVYGTCTAVYLFSPLTISNNYIQVDLGDIYFIKNITFATGCHNSWQGQLSFGLSSLPDTNTIKYIFSYADIIFSNYLDPKKVVIPDVNTFARYIFVKSILTSPSYTSPISYLDVNAFHASCNICPASYYCPTKYVSDKTICPAGYYCPSGSTAPKPCGIGMWSFDGASVCISCPPNSTTFVQNASDYRTQCVCAAGFSGIANRLEPQYQNFSNADFSNASIPVSAAKVINTGGVINRYYTDLNLLWDGAPVVYNYGSKYSNLYADDVSPGPISWIEYDMGQVIPISKIVGIPGIDRAAYWYSFYTSFVLSVTGEFAGEEVTVLPVQCTSPTSCTAPDAPLWYWTKLGFSGKPDINTWGYWAQFYVINARYVRWYLNLGQGTYFQQLSIYQCQGSSCFSCTPCALNSYCPGTQVNETYTCPSGRYTFVDGVTLVTKGASSAAECQCPLNAAVSESGICVCNAGYYYQQNTSYQLNHVGWQCTACPANTTSLPGALNYSECFCSGGLQSVSLNPSTAALPDTALRRFTEQPPFRLTITLKPDTVLIFAYSTLGNSQLLNDGANVGNANYWKYPNIAGTWLPWVTAPVWVQYDLRGMFPITKIIAKTYVDGRLYSSFSLQVSTTGKFSGEETVVFSCGFTLNVWCPQAVSNVGHTASFTVKYARYVRWYLGANDRTGGRPELLQLSVYYGTKSYNCIDCSSNSYCPSKVINQTFKCPNSTFSFVGASSVSQCVCPANAAVQSGTTNCSCNAGYYYSTNATALLNAGWQCNACPPNLLSPIGSTSITQCICVAGYYPTNPLVSMQECSICPLNTYCPFKSIAPVPCPPGTTSNNSLGAIAICTTPCPPGFYCLGDTEILPCPSGSYSTGGANSAQCTTCEPGYFCNTTVTRVVCPQGFYCPSGTVTPIPCPVTTYSLGGASVCTTCEIGYFCPTVLGHVKCPAINYCPIASTAPIPCEPGLYSCAGSGICTIQCPPGGFCPGNGTVIACPLGSFSNGGATDTGCTPCPEGFFCDFSLQLTAAGVPIGNTTSYLTMLGNYSTQNKSQIIRTLVPANWNCSGLPVAQSCPAGLFSSPGSISCNLQCPAAYYCPGNGSALLCPGGTYSVGGADSPACTPCPANYYCVNGVKSVCPAGKISDAGSAVCSIPCPAGFYCPGVGYPIQCSIPGTYSFAGSVNCTTCEPGYYCPTFASHLFCPPNTWSLSGSTTSCTLPCPSGVICPGNGKMSCTVCATGVFTVRPCSAEGDTICNATCPPGMFGAFYTKGFCQNCEQGYSNNQYGMTTCSSCTTGYYANTTGNSVCSQCPSGFNTNKFTGYINCQKSCVASPGYYCPSVVGEPIRCLRGFYCPDGNGMIPCPVNTYNANDGGNALSSCQQCTTRTVTSGTGFTQCSVCSAGTFYNDVGGVKQCTTCPSGQSSIADSDSCSSCLVGHYSEAQTCSICKPGTYQDTPGAASCKACPDGTYTYSSNTSASGAAIFLPQWGAVSLDQCINLPTFGAPLVCLPGTYMTAGNCLPCPIGYYCPSMQISANDASAIRICPGGTMSKQKGAISQNDCTEVSLLQDYKFNNCKLADGDTQVLDPLTVTSSVTSKSTGTLYFTTATAIYRVFLLKTTSSLELLAGDATTAATNGDVSNGLNVRFTSLNAIAVDYDANEATLVVVADNNAIRMVNVFTKEVTLLGNKGDVHQAGGIALQKDAQGAKKAYVSDVTNNRIMVFDMQNLQSNLVAGSISGFPGAVDASFSYASFKSPRGLAFLEKNLNAAKLLLVADSGNGKIRVIDTQTRNVNTWFSPLDRTTPELTAPTSINVALISPDSSSTPLIYVVDAGKVKVIQFPLSSDSTVKVISSVSLAPGVTMTFQNAIPYGKPNIFNNVVVGFPNLIILDGVNKKIRAFVEQGISGTPATCHLSCEDTSCGELTVAKLCGNSFLDTVGEFSEQCDDGGANLGGCNQGTCAINDGYACPKPLTHCLNPCQAYTYEPTGVKYCPQDCLTLTPRSGFTIDAECKEHDIDECALGTATCGPQAICDNKPGTYTCKCLSTFFGDGVNCVGSAYAVYSIVDLPTTYPSPVFTNALSNPDASGSKNTLNALEVLKNKYAAMLTTFLPESMRVAVGFSMNTTQLAMGYTYVSVDPVYKLKTRMELVSLFPTVEIAQEAAAKTTQSGALADSLSRAFFNDSSVMTVFQQPKVRKHTSYSFTNPNTIEAWGMNITGVNYNRTCVVSGVTPTGGCWQVEMIYVGGAALPNPDENPAVEIPQSKNVLYLPRIDHNPDTMELLNPSQALTESSGIAFPCSTTSSSVVGLGINKQATACCFRDFNAMYRPHAGFADFLASSDFTSGAPEGYCNSQNVFNDTYPSSSVVYTNPGAGEGATNDLVVGKIQGMPHSEVRLLETIDYTTRTFRVLLVLEEGDLRQSASTIKGTLGLDYNLTFFVGLANFKGTGTSVVNTKNMQQFITVSKSNMLTISSYGANQDPLVTISDMQLNRIKVADFFQPIKYLYYLQAYFQMPQNFKVLAGGSGIVPLDSIRVIKTKDIPTASDPRWMQACASADGKFIYANSSLQQLVATAQASTCVKDYLQMCAPPQTVNQVVTFGIPLPQDLISDSDLTAFPPYSLQLQFMVQAFDTDARGNVLTSLSMSVDLSSLGMKRMCESITASQSLADIVSGNIYIGTAANDYEWTTTLQKKVNMDVPGAGKPSNSFEFQTVTVQGSVMTFTALGDPNYFLDARATSQSININDIYSVNFLEPLGGKTGTSPNFEKVKALFLNGSAFDLKTDPVNHIAWLQPSKALLDICPLRPTSGHMICLTRVHSTISNNTLKRDVKDVVEIRPGEASSIQEMKGLMGHVMLQGGTNGFTDMLGTNFSNQLINKLNLNNRFRKAYVLNPLVDWSYQAMQESQPQSTAYTVCTKIIAIGLITVNSGTGGGQLARRLLSTSMDLNPSSISEPSYFAIQSNPTSMGRALLQVSPALNSGILAPTSTQSANSLVVNLDIPGYDSVTHLCEILLGVSYDKCNVLQFHNLLIGSKASELCSSHSDGVLGDTLTNTFSNVLRDPNGLSQIVGVFVLDYSLQGCENLIPSINPNAPQSRRLLQTGDVVNDFIVSMKTNILIGNMNGTSILSLNRMDELGKWLNTTIFPNIVSGGGFVTALELVYKPGTDGKIGGVQVVIHLNNSSSVNTTFLQEKLKSIAGGDKITDIMFSDGTTTFTTQKSSASSSRKTLPYYLILLINTLTLLSISALFSGVEYKLS